MRCRQQLKGELSKRRPQATKLHCRLEGQTTSLVGEKMGSRLAFLLIAVILWSVGWIPSYLGEYSCRGGV